jgi:hypothetical protein
MPIRYKKKSLIVMAVVNTSLSEGVVAVLCSKQWIDSMLSWKKVPRQ